MRNHLLLSVLQKQSQKVWPRFIAVSLSCAFPENEHSAYWGSGVHFLSARFFLLGPGLTAAVSPPITLPISYIYKYILMIINNN